MSAATHALVGEINMAEEANNTEVKDPTPGSSKEIKQATPEAVAEAEAAQKAAEEKAKAGEAAKNPPVDYKAELEARTKELEQAKFLLKKKNEEDKARRDAEKTALKSTDDDGDDSTPPQTDVDKKLEEFKLSQLHDVISTELASMSDNSDERGLIEFYFKNVIKRSGDTREAIKSDLETARFLANRKRFEKIDEELKAKSKSTPGAGSGSGGHNIEGDTPKDTPNVSDADVKLLKRYGLKPEDIKS